MRTVHITETVLRDANQSLIATRLPFADFEGILSALDSRSMLVAILRSVCFRLITVSSAGMLAFIFI